MNSFNGFVPNRDYRSTRLGWHGASCLARAETVRSKTWLCYARSS
jgi:hypothetical protein